MTARDPDPALPALPSSWPRGEEPPQNDCRGEDDLGKLQFDDETDTWYECMFDQRHDRYAWVIIPAPDDCSSCSRRQILNSGLSVKYLHQAIVIKGK